MKMTTVEIYKAGYAIPSLPLHWFQYKDKRFKFEGDLSGVDSIEIDTGYGIFPAYSVKQLRENING